eukprot:1806785-Alexandrium_andersonii.AAC.1
MRMRDNGTMRMRNNGIGIGNEHQRNPKVTSSFATKPNWARGERSGSSGAARVERGRARGLAAAPKAT